MVKDQEWQVRETSHSRANVRLATRVKTPLVLALKHPSSTLIAESYSSLKALEQCILAAPGSFSTSFMC